VIDILDPRSAGGKQRVQGRPLILAGLSFGTSIVPSRRALTSPDECGVIVA